MLARIWRRVMDLLVGRKEPDPNGSKLREAERRVRQLHADVMVLERRGKR